MAILRLDRLGPAAAALLRVLGAPPGAALVGGAVRDTVLGRAVADVDVAVPSGALDLARRCAERLGGRCVVLDAERGAARVVTDGGLTLDLTDFRAPSLEGDLAARDFTVDALAVPLAPLLARGRAARSWPRTWPSRSAAARGAGPRSSWPRCCTTSASPRRGGASRGACGSSSTTCSARAARAPSASGCGCPSG